MFQFEVKETISANFLLLYFGKLIILVTKH